jgi:PHD/YefM family antitoxin component YafN of YafNO toxin-antitoxin module
MASRSQTVGIREFREDMARYMSGSEPIAVTKNGRVVGYYIPTADTELLKAELERLKATTAKMEAFLSELDTNEDDIVTAFDEQRKAAYAQRN